MSDKDLDLWCCECMDRHTHRHLNKNYCKTHYFQAIKVDQIRDTIRGFFVGSGVPDPLGCADDVAKFVKLNLIAGHDFCFEMLYTALHHKDSPCQMTEELTETEFNMMFENSAKYEKSLKKW